MMDAIPDRHFFVLPSINLDNSVMLCVLRLTVYIKQGTKHMCFFELKIRQVLK